MSRLVMVKTCRTCEWCFGEHDGSEFEGTGQYICAGNSSVVEYGSVITNFDFVCDCWSIGVTHFEELLESGWSVDEVVEEESKGLD